MQEHGWAGISFFYAVTDLRGKQVKIQISTSPRFDKVAREFSPQGQSYFWRCEMTGKIYWRLVLQAGDGKTLATTPVRSFVVIPSPVTTMPLTQGSPLQFSASGLDFQWSADKPAKAIFYRFKLAEDKTFDHPLINVDGRQHSFHVDKLGPGHYFWKVGVKYTCTFPIVYSAIREFTVTAEAKPAVAVVKNEMEAESDDMLDAATVADANAKPADVTVKQEAAPAPIVAVVTPPPPPIPPPAPPELTEPPDQARIETLEADKNLMLQWNSGPQVRKFLVEIAKSRDFADATSVSSEPMRLSVTLQPGHFFWRVTATDERGQKSQPSAIQSFELVQRKIAITLLTPEKDRLFSYGKRSPAIVFGWHTAAAPDETFTYRLQIARDSSWREITTDREIKAESMTVNDLADGSYSWRVGVQIAGNAPMQYSDSGTFNLLKKASISAAPRLAEPADGARMESASKALPVSLRWSAPPASRAFVIEVADNESFTNAEKFSSLQPEYDLKRGAGHFFWRVKALDEAGEEGAVSPPRSFFVVQASQSIKLGEPSAGGVVGSFTVSFGWESLEGCISYRLTVSASSTMESPLREMETKETSFRTKLDDEDTYFWTVSCRTLNGQTIKSASQSFRIVING